MFPRNIDEMIAQDNCLKMEQEITRLRKTEEAARNLQVIDLDRQQVIVTRKSYEKLKGKVGEEE